jgi:hypothetical protein
LCDVQVFSGADSPCPFDITFTGSGTIKLTTYYGEARGFEAADELTNVLPHLFSSCRTESG